MSFASSASVRVGFLSFLIVFLSQLGLPSISQASGRSVPQLAKDTVTISKEYKERNRRLFNFNYENIIAFREFRHFWREMKWYSAEAKIYDSFSALSDSFKRSDRVSSNEVVEALQILQDYLNEVQKGSVGDGFNVPLLDAWICGVDLISSSLSGEGKPKEALRKLRENLLKYAKSSYPDVYKDENYPKIIPSENVSD